MRARGIAVCATLLLGGGLAEAASFTATTSLPEPYSVHALVAVDGRVYHLGGLSGAVGVAGARRTYSASIQGDGALGAWTAGPELPERVFSHAGVAWNRFVYVLGGQHVNSSGLAPSRVVYYTPVGADGALGAWQETTSLPESAFFLSAAIWRGRVYVTGGWNGLGLTPGVYSAPTQPDGTLGAWRAEPPLPEGIYTHAAVAEDTLYVLGGIVNQGAGATNRVYQARINADGTLQPWLDATPLPQAVSNHRAVVFGGRVYVAGGVTADGALSSVVSAPVLSDKSLGDWEAFAQMPAPRYAFGATQAGGRLYVSGGINGSPQSDVWFITLPTPPAQLLAVRVTLSPNTLNLMSNGQTVTARLELLPSQAVAADIDPASVSVVRVNGQAVIPIPANAKPISLEDEDGNGILELKVKFDRQALQAVLAAEDNVVEVAGRLRDGRPFEGKGDIWGKAPGRRRGREAKTERHEAPTWKLDENACFAAVGNNGGAVRGKRASVVLPEGALHNGLAITVTEAPDASAPVVDRRAAAAARKGVRAIGGGAEYGPHGTPFSKPVTIELPYERAALPAGVSESELAVHYWNDAAGEWEPLASSVDTLAQVVRAQTPHFSFYQILSGGGAAAGDAGEFRFGEVYAYPNPARPGQRPAFHVEAPGAERVELSVYDIAGELRHSADLAGPASVFTHVWDAGVGSGVYVYSVTARKAGASIRRVGKLAVIK